MDATDSYVLVGADPGFPLPIVAHFTVSGSIGVQCRPYPATGCSGGSVTAYFSDSVGTSVNGSLGNLASFQLTLNLSKSIGEPFTLYWNAAASSFNYDQLTGSADGSAKLSFDLPPGTGIMSCGGFSQGVATPTARSTWGSLKTRYR